MRLINTETYQVEEFLNERTVPPYAILSHTWGNEEVNLQQFQDAHRPGADSSFSFQVQSKSGHKKIMMACEQARKNRLKLLWVDTCCIDKTSSVELSEAINSMFRWYQKSEVCYAYLDDISAPEPMSYDEDISTMRARISPTELQKARWFTRGWTLQELIAPTTVEFYLQGWVFVGKKQTLSQELSFITGISMEILENRVEVRNYSVATRMSWAAKRVTTRVEDMAYSLFGIFDVNMSLLYGEGIRALARLQEEILKNTEDHTLFLWDDEHMSTTERARRLLFSENIAFADDPLYFIEARRFAPATPTGEPATVTSRGVKIELPILDLWSVFGGLQGSSHFESRFNCPSLYLAVLCCNFKDSSSDHPAIVVSRYDKVLGPNTFIRHPLAPIVRVCSYQIQSSDVQQIYLAQKQSHLSRAQMPFSVNKHHFRPPRDWHPAEVEDQLKSFLLEYGRPFFAPMEPAGAHPM